MRRGIDLNNHHDPDVRWALTECDNQEAREHELRVRELTDIGEHENPGYKTTRGHSKNKWTDEMLDYVRRNMEVPDKKLSVELNTRHGTTLTPSAVGAKKSNIRKELRGEF